MTVERSLLICFVPRSGSWFLAGLLASTGVAGRPSEFFWAPGEQETRAANRPRTDGEHLDWVLREGASSNGSFGCKFQWDELQDVLGRLRLVSALSRPVSAERVGQPGGIEVMSIHPAGFEPRLTWRCALLAPIVCVLVR